MVYLLHLVKTIYHPIGIFKDKHSEELNFPKLFFGILKMKKYIIISRIIRWQNGNYCIEVVILIKTFKTFYSKPLTFVLKKLKF